MTSHSDPIRNAAEVTLTREEALRESAYIAGLKRGYNIGLREDHEQLGKDIAARGNYLRALSAGEPVAWQADKLLALLRQHHDWHLQSGIIGLPDGDGGWIEIDNALEYSDSRMYEETQAALEGQPAPELEPMPRGGINTWWWQIAVLQRREIRALKAQIAAAPQPVTCPWNSAADFLARTYPDNANTNAFCAALRSQAAPNRLFDAHPLDGGGK